MSCSAVRRDDPSAVGRHARRIVHHRAAARGAGEGQLVSRGDVVGAEVLEEQLDDLDLREAGALEILFGLEEPGRLLEGGARVVVEAGLREIAPRLDQVLGARHGPAPS